MSPAESKRFIAFTICSNNYLPKAIILGNSLLENNPAITFAVIIMDRKSKKIDYGPLRHFELIYIEDIFPQVSQLRGKYNIIEFCTAVKPLIFQYFLSKMDYDIVLYFDPDIKVYNKLDPVFEQLKSCQIVLTPHILTPIPSDGFYPDDNAFLIYGIYNLGFLGVRKGKESAKMLEWWKNHTISKGFINIERGQFTDQLPMELVPVFFKEVNILEHPGLNMAPWNLHERFLEKRNGEYILNNGNKLIFYHFSNFEPKQPLKISRNGWYNRFTLEQRADLYKLYTEYTQDLMSNHYLAYSNLPCYFYPPKKDKITLRKLLIKVFQRMIKTLKK